MKRLAILCILGLTAAALGQEDPQEAARRRVRAYLEARKAWEERGITTGLSDSFADAPFLDGYTPERFAPLAEMPRVKGRGYLLTAPGGYQMDAVAFCLQPGAYRPSRGEGYLPAPLTGRAAALVGELLWNWAEHPEIDRRAVQHLLWALEDRADFSKLPASLLPAARTLLGARGLEQAAALARGPAPDMPDLADPVLAAELEKAAGAIRGIDPGAEKELEAATKALEALMARLQGGEPPAPEAMQAALERLARAQEKLLRPLAEDVGRLEALAEKWRATLLDPEVLFEEVERAAILDGDPAPPAGSMEIPPGRWALDPGGFFVRYLPEDHTRAQVELSLPREFRLERDGRGRPAAVALPAGARLSLAYDDGVAPLAAAGDPGAAGHPLAGYALGPCRLSLPGSAAPLRIDPGWTFVGTPAGNGRVSRAPAAFKGARGRYRLALRRQQEIERLALAAGASAAEPDLVDLAHLAAAIEEAAPDGAGTAQALRLLKEAWQAALLRRPESDPVEDERPGGSRGPCAPEPSHTAYSKPGGLPAFDPGKRGLNPGNSARQRLGTGSTQDPHSDGKQAFQAALKGCEFIQGLLDVFNGLTDPMTFIMEKFGLGAGGLPGTMLGEMVGWIFEASREIAAALGGDPPRPDFDRFALPPAPELPLLEPRAGLSQARAAAGNAAARSLAGLFTALRAAQIAGDRLGGALQAGDEEWVARQAAAYVHYKRLAGNQMLAAAESYARLLELLEAEGVQERGVAAADYRAYMEGLKANGLRPSSLEAARRLGLGEAEIAAALRRRLAADPGAAPEAGLLEAGRGLVDGLRALGSIWSALPEDDTPQRFPDPLAAGAPKGR